MTVYEVKQYLDKNIMPPLPLIFVNTDNSFLSEQYTSKIKDISGLDLEYIDSLSVDYSSFFYDEDISLKVFITDKLSQLPKKDKNIIVICNSVEKGLESDYICKMPKLEKIWIKDFVYSNLEGIDTKSLDKLIEDSNYNIFRLQNEINKLKHFKDQEKKVVFSQMVDDGAFDDISSNTIFDLSNAILKKDKIAAEQVLRKLSVIDCEPLGLVTILYQNFKKYIQVWLAKNPTEENTGIKQNAIYAISKAPKVYSTQQLLSCFQFLCSIDKELKLGNIEIKWLIDYIICKLFTV